MRPSAFRPLALLALLAGCGDPEPPAAVGPHPPAPPITAVTARRVVADLSVADPGARYWREIQPGTVTLLAQPMIAPRPETTTTAGIEVQAVHDGTTVAFRLRWADTEPSEAGRLGEYSDAVALQFPVQAVPLPPVFMGAKDHPVHLFHWRAQYQRDMERGKPTVKELYPNASIDMYPMEFKEAAGGSEQDQQSFNPGIAVGNPQSYSKTGVDEIIAEGFSTSSVEEGHGAKARGVWADGAWTVVITRPLAIEGGSNIVLGPQDNHMAFAVWQGGLDEVASRKCITMAWLPLRAL